MLDLTKPENRCTVGGAEYVAIDGSREPDSCCEKCEGLRTLEMCVALKPCAKGDRPDKKEIYWRPASEVEGIALVRDGYRLLWPDEPREEGDEVYKEGLWELDDLSFPMSFVHGRARRRKVG